MLNCTNLVIFLSSFQQDRSSSNRMGDCGGDEEELPRLHRNKILYAAYSSETGGRRAAWFDLAPPLLLSDL